MKSSLFSKIRSWFRADLDGRYLGLILAEIGAIHPTVLLTLIRKICAIPKGVLQHPRFEAEYCFRGKSGLRRADLAVFDGDSVDPVVLIEIKYYDKPSPETEFRPAQLSDYAHWVRQGDGYRYGIVLSRETIWHDTLCVMRWTEVARHLRVHSGSSDLVLSLIEHLEEEGLVMQNIDSKALIGFLKRFLCSHNRAGQLAGNISGPGEFGKLLNNVKLLAGRFNPDFKDAWGAGGGKLESLSHSTKTRIASIDFGVWSLASFINTESQTDLRGGRLLAQSINERWRTRRNICPPCSRQPRWLDTN
jgi:hypothetical protein